jgi:hypothetical protein
MIDFALKIDVNKKRIYPLKNGHIISIRGWFFESVKKRFEWQNDVETKELIDLYGYGYSTIELAKRFGMSDVAVNARIKSGGAMLRSVSDAVIASNIKRSNVK